MQTEFSNPLVSVLMTCFNREIFIGDAIKSVLQSTYINFELIICDDCSSDTTFSIAAAYAEKDSRIQLYRNDTNVGDYPNRNIAASYAKGKYIKYVDSDDIIKPDGLYKMVLAMEIYPEAALGISQFALDEKVIYPQLVSSEQAYKNHYFGLMFLSYGPTGAIIRSDVFKALNGFTHESYISDTTMWLRLSALYPVVEIEPGVVEWRSHPAQEYQYGQDNHSYLRRDYPISMESLNSKDCPLRQEDIMIIKKRLQWKHARDILNLMFKQGKPVMAFKIFLESGLSVSQLIWGILPYNRVKKSFVH